MSSDQNDYNKVGLFTFVLSMAVSLGVMIYVATLSSSIDLKEVKEISAEPGAQAPVAEAGPIDISDVKDPWMSSPLMISRGKQLFVQNCQMCHGPEGKGDGPAGMALNPRPRNFVEGKWKKGGTRLGLMGVLLTGLPPSSMQSYKQLPVSDRWALVHFVRSITQNLVKDDDADVAAKAPSLK
jgi:mono/diheme cytochrome c family protein